MARIRTVKPEFWTSEQIAMCSPLARLLFIGLWSFCDDGGVHPASIKRLKMEVFPADAIDDEAMRGLIGELVNARLLEEYDIDGERFWHVTGWHRHQKIERPTIRHPRPPQRSTNSPSIRRDLDESSPNARRDVVESSPTDRNGVEGNGIGKEERGAADAAGSLPEKSSKAKRTSKAQRQLVLDQLDALIVAWNELPKGIAPRCAKRTAKLVTTFGRANSQPEVQAALSDVGTLMATIRESPFLHGQGWFTFSWLLSKDRSGEWNATKIIGGNYRDRANSIRPSPAKWQGDSNDFAHLATDVPAAAVGSASGALETRVG